ncbi:MAG: hypothetical protein Q9227_004557 [Pyrenula ochraceoflavens]
MSLRRQSYTQIPLQQFQRLGSEYRVDTNASLPAIDQAHNERDEPSAAFHRAAHPIQAQQTTAWQSSWLENGWSIEVLLWILGTASLTGIIVIFLVLRKQSIDKWHSKLEISTIVSTMVTVQIMALTVPLYNCMSQWKWIWFQRDPRPVSHMEYLDDASRGGPLDNLLLAWKLRALNPTMIGAVAFLLVPFVGPAAQESVSTPLRSLTANEATIDRCVMYDSTSSGTTGTDRVGEFQLSFYSNISPVAIPQWTTADQTLIERFDNTDGRDSTFDLNTVVPTMKAALLDGLYTSVSPSLVRANCPSGNCTFDEYTSLAVCSSLGDTTSNIVKHCPRGKSDETSAGCTYTVAALEESPPWLGLNMSAELDQTIFIGANNPSNAPRSSNSLIDFYVIYYSDLSQLSMESNYTAQLKAFKASLNLCLQTFRTSVNSGTTTTEETRRRTDLAWKKEPTTKDGVTFQILSTKVSDDPDTYSMSDSSIQDLNTYLSILIFTGAGQMQDPADLPTSSDKNNLNTFTSDAAHALANRLYNNGTTDNAMTHADALLSNVAVSMTNVIRQTSNFPTTHKGISNRLQQYIHVKFPWLVPAILLDLLTLLFLLQTISASRSRDVPVWKQSQIAVLQALGPGLGGHPEPISGEGTTALRVRLKGSGDGEWKLVEGK